MKERLNDLCENISRVKSLFWAYASSQTDMRDKGIIEEDLIKLFDGLDKMIIKLYKDISFYKNTEKAFCNALDKIEKMKCCGNCKHRNTECVVETCRKNKIYTLNKGFCDNWELAEMTEKEYLKLKEENEQLKQELCKKEREFKYFSNSFKLKIQKLKDEIEMMKGEQE